MFRDNTINQNIYKMDDFKILTILKDEKIGAYKAIFEMTIGFYITLAKIILDKNEYQRRRVKDSKSVYSLLRDDLKKGCTIPSIVLAYRSNERLLNVSIERIENSISDFIKADDLIILDGLQRTYCLMDVADELENDADKLKVYLASKLTIECYIGIDKIGILYRMLTLNTGQTKMSLRHQIEILYSNFKENKLDDITFYTQVDGKTKVSPKEFQFKDAIDCFYSYIERDPNGIERADVLDNIQNLESLSEDNRKKDLFEDLIDSYSCFLATFINIDSTWSCKDENSKEFGKDVIYIFNRSIPLSAFGAAVGDLKDSGIITNVSDVKSLLGRANISKESYNELLDELIRTLSKIKTDATKIGKEQRWFYFYFFKALFLCLYDGKECTDVVTKAYQRYKVF